MKKQLLSIVVAGVLMTTFAYATPVCKGHLVPGNEKCASVEYMEFKHPHRVCNNSYADIGAWSGGVHYAQCHWIKGACHEYSKIGRAPDHCSLPPPPPVDMDNQNNI